jgi:hypothetical protein
VIIVGIGATINYNIKQKDYYTQARELLLIENCLKIKDVQTKEECVVYVASQKSKESLDFFSCIDIQTYLSNNSVADKYYERCVNNVYFYLAKDKKNYDLCKEITERELIGVCIKEVDNEYLDGDDRLSVCARLGKENKKTFCYKNEFNNLVYSSSYCNKFQGEIKQICLEELL